MSSGRQQEAVHLSPGLVLSVINQPGSPSQVFGYVFNRSSSTTRKPPCCPTLCAVPIARWVENDLTLNLVSTSGNTCTHAHNHTSTPTHPSLTSSTREANMVSSQSSTTTPGTPKFHMANRFGSLLYPHMPALILMALHAAAAALEPGRTHPHFTGRPSTRSHTPSGRLVRHRHIRRHATGELSKATAGWQGP